MTRPKALSPLAQNLLDMMDALGAVNPNDAVKALGEPLKAILFARDELRRAGMLADSSPWFLRRRRR